MSICEDVHRFLDDPGNLVSHTIHELPEIALIKFSDGNTSIDVSQLIQVDPDSMIMGFASINETGNSVVLRFSTIDERLKRMMNDKSPQFSKDEVNLWVIDLYGFHGFKKWPPLALRLLQPKGNRRFSGIILRLSPTLSELACLEISALYRFSGSFTFDANCTNRLDEI